ncbi:hypothetical protein ACFPQC_68850, partial [Kibdelosporangium philippinense]
RAVGARHVRGKGNADPPQFVSNLGRSVDHHAAADRVHGSGQDDAPVLGGLPVYLALSTVAYVSIRAIVAKWHKSRNPRNGRRSDAGFDGPVRGRSLHGPPEAMPRDEFLKRANGKDGLLTMLSERVDAELLDAAGPQLKIVANHAVGYDNIDVAECTRRGVWSRTRRTYSPRATADLGGR